MKRRETLVFACLSVLFGMFFSAFVESVVLSPLVTIVSFLFLTLSFSYLQGDRWLPFNSGRTCACACGCGFHEKECSISQLGTCASCENGNHKPPVNLELTNLTRLIEMHESIAEHYRVIREKRKLY